MTTHVEEKRRSNISQESYIRIRNMLKLNVAGDAVCTDKYSRTHSFGSFDKSLSQWELLVRKFSKDSKEQNQKCLATVNPEEITCELLPPRTFPTGSQYEGTWDIFGMSGYGKYTYPNGVIYEGEFEDNTLHGEGELIYPDGIVLKGRWNHGELLERTIILEDCVHYTDVDWTYCQPPDRRFVSEFFNGLQAGGAEYMTAEVPSREIVEGMYDVGDGFYDPITKSIYKYDDITSITRYPTKTIRGWIEANCRTNPYTKSGPLPDSINHIGEVKLEPEVDPSPECLSEASMEFSNPNMTSTASSMWRRKVSEASPWCKTDLFQYDPAADRPDKMRTRHSRSSRTSRTSQMSRFGIEVETQINN